MSEQTSIWKKEIHLRRRPQPASQPSAPHATWQTPKRTQLWTEPEVSSPVEAPAPVLPSTKLDPEFRKIDVLRRLLATHADRFPDRTDDWWKMLDRLSESAHKGVLPAELDGVV